MSTEVSYELEGSNHLHPPSINLGVPACEREIGQRYAKDEGRLILTSEHSLALGVESTSDVGHGTIGADELLQPCARWVVAEVLEALILHSLVCFRRVDGLGADVLQGEHKVSERASSGIALHSPDRRRRSPHDRP